jgi:outer membrane protein
MWMVAKRPAQGLVLAGLLSASGQAMALNLLEAYDKALQHDPKLVQAEAARQAAAEDKPLAISRLLPKVGMVAAADNVNRDNKTGFIPQGGKRFDSYWNLSLDLQMTQPIYHHDYWVKLGQADSTVAQAAAEYETQLQSLAVRTAEAYFQVWVQGEVLAFAAAEKDSLARQLAQIKQRYADGIVAVAEVYQAQAAYDQAVAVEIQAHSDLDDAKEALRAIVGEPVDSVRPLAENLPLQEPQPGDAGLWAERALNGNFAVIAARNGVDVARKEVDVQRAGHAPHLDLVAAHTIQDSSRDIYQAATASQASQWLKMGPRAETDSVGLQLTVPIFQGGAVDSNTRRAGHELERAQGYLDELLREADRSAKSAYRGVLSSISQVNALKSAIASAQSALEAAQVGYDVGTTTLAELLMQESKLYQAKRDHARARYKYVLNGFVLKQAAGILSREDVEGINTWVR